MSHFKTNASDAPKDLNCMKQPVSAIDNISDDLLTSQSCDQLPANSTAMDVIVTDDKVTEPNEDNLVNDIIDLTTMDSDIITIDDSLSQSTYEGPITNLDEFYDFVYNFNDNSDDDTPETIPKLLEQDENINIQVKKEVQDGVITLDDIFDPIFMSVCNAGANEKPNGSQIANTDNNFDLVLESVCKARENEKPNESQTADMDICDRTIESTGKVNNSTEKTKLTTVNTMKYDTIEENIIGKDELFCPQAPLKSFDIQDLEEQIQLFKILQKDYDIPQNELVKEEELARCVVEIGEKYETTLNVNFEGAIKLDNSEQKNLIWKEMSLKKNVTDVKTEDLNNAELKKISESQEDEIPLCELKNAEHSTAELKKISESQEDEIPLCELKNAEHSTLTTNNDNIEELDSDYCAGYHSSDFEFISESEAEAEGLYFKSKSKKTTLKNSNINSETPSISKDVVPSTINSETPSTSKDVVPTTINSETPSTSKDVVPSTINSETPATSKDVVPSTANGNNFKQNYSSLHVQFPTSAETRKRENCETLQDQNNILKGIPSSSKDAAMPSTSNNIQERDYKSLRLKFLADEENRMREHHKIPQDQEYLDLFGGPNAPIANNLFILENKSARAWCMDINYEYEGVGFDARYNMPQNEASEEDKKAAAETTKNIQEMYPRQNRARRRKF